jgi:hypothetical protein
MTRGLRPNPVDEKVAASDLAGEEDISSGHPSASGERLRVDEAEEATIPFSSLDDFGLPAPRR